MITKGMLPYLINLAIYLAIASGAMWYARRYLSPRGVDIVRSVFTWIGVLIANLYLLYK